MAGNICPICGKAVMSYGRFLREAEPYKTSACGSCGSKLRRSRMVYVLIILMIIVLVLGIILPFFYILDKAHISLWLGTVIGVALVAGWGILVNYFGWRFIGWVAVEQTMKT